MHQTGQMYRPPSEADTPMLQVTAGCSHNGCAFCTMYRGTAFAVSPEHEIIEDLREIAAVSPDADRIYLLNGDPFILSAEKLLRIAQLIHEHLPKVNTITCYCSIRDIMGKSEDELIALRKAGYNELYVGLETAYEPAQKYITKGHTLTEAADCLDRIIAAGIDYYAMLMCGIAGKGEGVNNAKATAAFLNAHKPKAVSYTTTAASKGAPLYDMLQSGEFIESTELENVTEMLTLLENLQMDDDCRFSTTHPLNSVSVSGFFRDKNKLIEDFKAGMAEYSDDELNTVLRRSSI